ncbi:MAG TPA: LysR family transcriptional regulator, partial [Erysipelotrichaceae bacterium]|nr:LysR family transcriptional regulator [Erysipelotrichaceae bacterium]
ACFVCDVHHPLLQEKNLSFDRLLKEPLILTERNASYRTLLDLDLQKKGYEVQPIIESENTDLILSMIQNTQNITFLPYYLIQPYIKDGTLAKLPLDYTIPITRQLLYHKEKWVSPEMQAFIALLD